MRPLTIFLLTLLLAAPTIRGDDPSGGGGPAPGGGSPDDGDTEAIRRFVRGDADQDLVLHIDDMHTILNYVFNVGPTPALKCHDAADSNDDGRIDLSDAIEVFDFLFSGGPPPPAPFEECGLDPTEDALPTCEYSACDDLPPYEVPEYHPRWDDWVTWIHYTSPDELYARIDELMATDPALEGALWTNEVEALAEDPERAVLLTPQDEVHAVEWIFEHQEALGSRGAVTIIFLAENGEGAARLEELHGSAAE